MKEELHAPDLKPSEEKAAKHEAAVNTTKSLADKSEEERLSRIKPMSEEERRNYVNPYDEMPVGSSINKSLFVDK